MRRRSGRGATCAPVPAGPPPRDARLPRLAGRGGARVDRRGRLRRRGAGWRAAPGRRARCAPCRRGGRGCSLSTWSTRAGTPRALQAAVSARARAGSGVYRPERRPFWPHVTLARVKRGERAVEPLRGRTRRRLRRDRAGRADALPLDACARRARSTSRWRAALAASAASGCGRDAHRSARGGERLSGPTPTLCRSRASRRRVKWTRNRRRPPRPASRP